MSRLAPRLQPGDEVRIVCPSSSLEADDTDKKERIIEGFHKLTLTVSFSDHCFDANATIDQRVQDLHDAFSDTDVKAVWAGTGGFSSVELLPLLDFGLLSKKVFCGYSDITVLLNAIYARTGMITYHGPNAGGIGRDDFTDENLKKALFSPKSFEVTASDQWIDKIYSAKSPKVVEHQHKNDGWWSLNPAGIVEGRLVGGNITCLSLLKGTSYMPKLKGSILLIEDDYEALNHHFAAQFNALTIHEKFKGVEAILIGRFQKASGITRQDLQDLVSQNSALQHVPVIANVDFGHTRPQLVLPIGGITQVTCLPDKQIIKVIEH